MTVDPFDDLERQLRRRVAEARGTRRGRWRAHPFLAVLAVSAVTASGVAVAAGGLRRGPDDVARGNVIATAVTAEAARDPACKSPRFVKDRPITLDDSAPPRAVVDAMPWMREPAPSAELRRGLRTLNSGHPIGGTVVLRSTIHIVRLSARWSVLTRVERGQGGFTVRDPAACTTVRNRLLAEQAESEGLRVYNQAQRALAMDGRVNPEAMTLWFTLLSHGRPSTGVGRGLLPDAASGSQTKVRHGVIMAQPRPRSVTAYLGLARAAAVRMEVWSARADVRRKIPRTITVRRGFWRLELPRDTGSIRLTEIQPDGSMGPILRLRG